MASFKDRHPLFLSIYFLSVLLFTMFLNHPLVAAIALLGSLSFCLSLQGAKKLVKSIVLFLPLALLVALTNPLFSHNGQTVLFFLNSNPITMEAFLYGVNLSLVLMAVIYWFRCFNIIFTSDKLLYLFSKLSSKISILLSSALRFIPLLKRQSAKIKEAQTALGLYSSESATDKIKGATRTFSALTTWSLENAVETGASMKARGFGSCKRTSFSIFKHKKDDIIFSSLVIIIDVFLAVSIGVGNLSFSFYPTISQIDFNITTVAALIAFCTLYFLPFLIELKEVIKWKYLLSKI